MKFFSIPRHPVGMAGAVLSLFFAQALVVFLILDLVIPQGSPYIGVFAYLVLPILLLAGLAVLLVGVILDRRWRRRHAPEAALRRPILDLNNPRHRRTVGGLIIAGAAILFLTAGLEYRTYEFTESAAFCGQTCHTVMKPEFTAYQNSPHARVACTGCHVGPGASWWVKSKISGAHQVIAVTLNSFPRPIPGPIKSLRPAQATCEQCHWPEKFHGAQLKLFTYYAEDEENTRHELQMVLKTGGGSPGGPSAGIHWHMNIANEITYIARDSLRQDIPWVRIKDREGRVRIYQSTAKPLTAAEIASAKPRRMDCMDCHNRPTHIFPPPARLVNDALFQQRLDVSLPYIRREAVAALQADYATSPAAQEGISAHLADFYQKNYPQIWQDHHDRVLRNIAEVQRLYSISTFPEMKVNWKTYPTNIGHRIFPGCFRCHDNQHVDEGGETITKDCSACHTFLGQVTGSEKDVKPEEPLGGGVPFVHPEDIGDLKDANCVECHGPQAS